MGQSKHVLFIFVILLLVSACDRSKKKQPAAIQQAQKQPEWTTSFDSLRQQYRSLHMAYANDSTSMSPQARQMYHHMSNLWTQMQGMKSGMMQMMGTQGMMNGRGMMGGNRQGRHMMGLGTQPGHSIMRFREMNQQMVSYCKGMQQMMTQANDTQMAAMYQRMMNHAQQMMSQLPPDTTSTSVSVNNSNAVADGAHLYAVNCRSCHNKSGQGLTGVFPPLNGSSIVKGDKETLIKIVLKGLHGPVTVKNEHYNNIMPAFGSSLSNTQISEILTYIRSFSQNKTGKVTTEDVQNVRKSITNHQGPWTANELGIQ